MHSLEPDQRHPGHIHRVLGLFPRPPCVFPRDRLFRWEPRPHGEPRGQEQEPRHAREDEDRLPEPQSGE